MEDSNNAAQNGQFESKTHLFGQELIVPLRGEIVESEKARMDFLKYKLLAIAALGSIGLGLYNKTGGSTFEHVYILGIIPLVCLYVDLLCYHNTLRILVIGRYLANKDCPYENFISQVDRSLKENNVSAKGAGYLFEMEDWALEVSTLLLSGFILIFGFCMFYFDGYLMLTLIIPGLLGIILSCVFERKFNSKKEKLFAAAKDLKSGNQEG